MDHRWSADVLDFLFAAWRRLVAQCPINFRAQSVRQADNVIATSPVGVSYRGAG
jgi:hypothetical protein